MAVQSNVYKIGEGKTYHSTKPIPAKEFMAVWVAQFNPTGAISPKDLWLEVSIADYDLINDSAVFMSSYQQQMYEFVEVRVADTPDEILQKPSAFSIIAIIADDIQIVADIADEVVTVSDIAEQIVNCGSDPLMSAIIACGTEPLTSAIMNAGQNAILAAASALSANQSQEFSFQWSSEQYNVVVDDGEHIGRSSYHWSVVASLNAQGLTLQGTWNPNSGTAPVPVTIPEEDGFWWVVTEDSLAPVYGQTWRVSDKIVYMASEVPDPYMKLSNTVHWDNVIGTPQSLSVEDEYIVTSAIEMHYDIPHIDNSLIVSQNGIVLAMTDYIEDAFDVDNISAGFTLVTAPQVDDLIHYQGILAKVPASDSLIGYWNSKAERLTAESYAMEPHGTFVNIYTSNGDGTFTGTPTTDYSSLHWEVESNYRHWDSEAQARTANSTADEATDVLCKIYTSNDNGTFSSTDATYFSAFHWQEKAKLAGAGLNYIGLWDARTGVYPPDGTVFGDFYVCNHSGTVGLKIYSVGDWLIWDDVASDWNLLPWAYDWTSIRNVPENVSNALSRSGGQMTGQIKGVLPIADDDVAIKVYADKYFKPHSSTFGSIDDFLDVGTHFVSFKSFPESLPSEEKIGILTVGINTDADSKVISQLWVTAYAVFTRLSITGGGKNEFTEWVSSSPAGEIVYRTMGTPHRVLSANGAFIDPLVYPSLVPMGQTYNESSDWVDATVYDGGDKVQSATTGEFFYTTVGGTSAGDDTDLAGGTDTGVTWYLETQIPLPNVSANAGVPAYLRY